MFKIKNKSGFSLIEILLAITIFAIFTMGITYLSLDTLERDSKVIMSNEALLYAQEGIEATRNIRDKSFLALTNGDHGLDFTANSWSFDLAPELVDDFYDRTVTISDVYRTEAGDVEPDGLVFDPDTKRIDVRVIWLQRGVIPQEVMLTEYMSNWRGDDWIQTTCTEFNAGDFGYVYHDERPECDHSEGAPADCESGPETETVGIVAPPSDNCGVKIAEIEQASSFQTSANVGTHGRDVFVDGDYAYLAVNSVNNGLSVINISNKSAPSVVGSKNVGGKGRYVNKIGDIVYIGVEKNNAGMVAVDVSNPSNPVTKASIESSAYGNRADKTGDYLYIPFEKTNGSLWIYEITIAGGSVTTQAIKNINYGDAIRYILIEGAYAYIGLYDDTTGLRILSLADPEDPQEVGSLSVGEEVNAVAIDGNIAYLGTESSSNSLRIVNISNPASPALISSLDVGGEIEDLVFAGDYIYAAVDRPQDGLAAINVSNPYIPTLAYTLDVQGKGQGIDTDGSYIYIATDSANNGLVIVGTTVVGSSTNGSYLSEIFDTGSSDTTYNFIEWDAEEPNGTAVKFQVRTANSIEDIETANWVGPDGTGSTYYETSRTQIVLDPGASGSQYFQYKVFLDSDGTSTPLLNSVRINYIP